MCLALLSSVYVMLEEVRMYMCFALPSSAYVMLKETHMCVLSFTELCCAMLEEVN